eukprot:gene30676-137_t
MLGKGDDQGVDRGGLLCEADNGFQRRLKEEQTKLRRIIHGQGATKKVNQKGLINTIVQEYVEALNLTVDAHGKSVQEVPSDRDGSPAMRMFPQGEDVSSSMTKRMVRDLINIPVHREDG